MAERSNAASKKNKDAAQDVSTLQKRGRRRLVGAIALVLLAVIILPMIFDPEPKQNTSTVNIRIPSEEGAPFIPKVAPKPTAQPERKVETAPAPVAATKPEAAPPPVTQSAPAITPPVVAEPAKPAEKPVAKVEDKPVAKAPEVKPAAKKAPPSEPKAVEKKAAPAPAAAPGEKLIVQVGAFGSPEKVKEVTDQLKGAKLGYFTESIATAKGPVTRVRLGPFSSRESAEKARDRAKALGLNPANPVTIAPPSSPSSK
jgi:DedD protein